MRKMLGVVLSMVLLISATGYSLAQEVAIGATLFKGDNLGKVETYYLDFLSAKKLGVQSITYSYACDIWWNYAWNGYTEGYAYSSASDGKHPNNMRLPLLCQIILYRQNSL